MLYHHPPTPLPHTHTHTPAWSTIVAKDITQTCWTDIYVNLV